MRARLRLPGDPARATAHSTARSRTTRAATSAELLRLRASIDNIDAALIHLLAERFKCTQQVGELKAREGLPPADPAREEARSPGCATSPTTAGLDPTFAEKFLNFVIAEVIHHHEAIAKS